MGDQALYKSTGYSYYLYAQLTTLWALAGALAQPRLQLEELHGLGAVVSGRKFAVAGCGFDRRQTLYIGG